MASKRGRASVGFFSVGLGLAPLGSLSFAGTPACSSGFASCIESHTCPADEDAAGAGGAPESGVPTEGGAGNAGAPVAGGEAVAGDGAGIAALALVRTTPEDTAVDVERDQVIEVEFSSELDEDSVTESTFEVTGPSGRVEGDLSVDGATITFTPTISWSLLTDYAVTLAETVAASSGEELQKSESFAFRVRDGVMQKPQRLHAREVSNLELTGSRLGGAAVTFTDDEDNANVIMFDPEMRQWGKAHTLGGDGKAKVCFNSHGEAFATAGSEVTVWSRWSKGAWRTSQQGTAGYRICALGDDGTAMTLWGEIVGGSQWDVMASSVSPADSWSAPITLQANAGMQGVVNYGTGYLAFYTRSDPDYTKREVYSRIFQNGKWSAEKPVTPADARAQYVSFDARGESAIFAWQDAKMRMQAAIYDGSNWNTEELGPAFGANSSQVTANGFMTGWSYEGRVYVARYSADSGWEDPVNLGAGVLEEMGPEVGVDVASNALAAWASGGSVTWRRLTHASGEWEAPQHVADQDAAYVYVEGSDAGDAVLVWQNDLGVWASRFE